MKQPRVVMLSWFMNEQHRNLDQRIDHLLSKTYPNIRYLWIVGDSTDGTETTLRNWERTTGGMIQVVRADTGIEPSNPNERCLRASQALTAGLAAIREDDDLAIIHESDLRTPPDVVERFLASGKDIIAGWPVIQHDPMSKYFYDVWAYRAGGRKFQSLSPYHEVYKPNEIFEVDSVGSCWLFPAQAARNMVIEKWACVEMCAKLKEQGLRIWVDPTIEIVQPLEFWTSMAPASG